MSDMSDDFCEHSNANHFSTYICCCPTLFLYCSEISESHSEFSKWQAPKLTHWGRVTYICVGKLTIIGSDNGFSPDRRQAIIWTNDGILLIVPFGTAFCEILIEIHTLSVKKMQLKMSSGKWRTFCLGLNVLNRIWPYNPNRHGRPACRIQESLRFHNVSKQDGL